MSPTGRVLGIDPGSKRIGLAISDDMGWTARPLEVWRRTTLEADLAHLVDRVRVHEVVRIVVGVPYRLDGSRGPEVQRVEAFIEALRVALPGVPIEARDEALTTWVAEEQLKARGLRPLERRGLVDAYAAAVILQEALEASDTKRDSDPGRKADRDDDST